MAFPLYYIFNLNNNQDLKYPMVLNPVKENKSFSSFDEYKNCVYISSANNDRKEISYDCNNTLPSLHTENDIDSYIDCFSHFDNESDCSSVYNYLLDNINELYDGIITIDESYIHNLPID